MNPAKCLFTACITLLPYLSNAQVKPQSQPVSTQPNANPNLKVDPKLRLNLVVQNLTNGSRKRWILTGISTNGYKRDVDQGSCYSDNELILSSDQTATYSEGSNVCSMSLASVPNMQWKADGKKLTLSGIPAMTKNNSNALIGFFLGPDSEILELTDKTLRIKFKGSDGYMPDGSLNVITNEITYTAK